MLANLVSSKWAIRDDYSRSETERTLRIHFEEFARQNPSWAAALFDTHFIRMCLSRLRNSPNCLDPQQIAGEWASQLTLSPETRNTYVAELSALLLDYLSPSPQLAAPEGK